MNKEKKTLTIYRHIISDLAEFNPEKIILFGSYARGDYDEESDIDIIVVYQTEKRFLDRLEELYMKWNLSNAVDILAYTPDEFTNMMKDNYFLKQAVEEGVIIYERS
ncbi:MAG: nucleotidyltransferase domain-containing protein [Desulfobacterales bacterium]|jgi:predicted nucleotidyltransferase